MELWNCRSFGSREVETGANVKADVVVIVGE
jgi:hypothetical protein